MLNSERIVREFNRTNGMSYGFKSRAIIDLLSEVEAAGFSDEEFLLDVIRNNKTTRISSVLDPLFLQMVKKQKTNEEADKVTASLGAVEKALARVMLDEFAPTLADSVKSNLDKYIEDTYGITKKSVVFEFPQYKTEVKGVTHEKFETVMQFVSADEPVMLVGPAGTGKNVICKQIAEAMNLEFYFSNAVTQEYKLTGFIDANGSYHETQFYKAFKDGGLFMLDEMDASIPEVLIILNSAIANRYFDFPTGKIEANPNFRLVAAANTFGTGASYVYNGRNQLDGASLDRFAVIEINYSQQIENALTQDHELLDFIRSFRNACDKHGLNHIVSYRSITRLEKLKNCIELDELLRDCLCKNLEKDDLNMIISDVKPLNTRWTDALCRLGE